MSFSVTRRVFSYSLGLEFWIWPIFPSKSINFPISRMIENEFTKIALRCTEYKVCYLGFFIKCELISSFVDFFTFKEILNGELRFLYNGDWVVGSEI